MLPAIAAPLLIALSSRPSRKPVPPLCATPSELSPTSVILAQRAIVTAWTGHQAIPVPETVPLRTPQHVTV